MTKRYKPSNKSGKNSKAQSTGFDLFGSSASNLQNELIRRGMAMALNSAIPGSPGQNEESEDDMTTDGYDSYMVSTSAYDDSDEDDSEEDSSDDGIDEAEVLRLLQALQAKKQAKKEKTRQRKKRYASTTNDEDDLSDLDNLSPSEMTEEQLLAYERRMQLKEEKLLAQKARMAALRTGSSSRTGTPSSSTLSLPTTTATKDKKTYAPYGARREHSTGSTNVSGWETPPGTPPSLLAPAKPPKMPSLDQPAAPRKKKGAEFATAGVTPGGVGTVDIHHYPAGYPGTAAAPSRKASTPATVSSTASKIERFERKTSASSTSTRESVERRKPSVDRKAPPAGAPRREKKRE